jgi:hypothetical protein
MMLAIKVSAIVLASIAIVAGFVFSTWRDNDD